MSSGGATVIRDDDVPAIGGGGQRVGSGSHVRISLSGLVLDGVAAVRIVDKSGASRARSVTVPVTSNVFHAPVPRHMGPRAHPMAR
jgi:hypothetical protein